MQTHLKEKYNIYLFNWRMGKDEREGYCTVKANVGINWCDCRSCLDLDIVHDCCGLFVSLRGDVENGRRKIETRRI